MSTLPEFKPAPSCHAIWSALCEDTTANVVVCDREGAVLYANPVAQQWFRWRDPPSPTGAGSGLFDDRGCLPGFLEERRRLCQEVCDSASPVTYESVCRNIRYRVTMRPIPREGGPGHDALIVSRRMQPWERADQPGGPDRPPSIAVEHHDPGVFASLSARELEVLVLIAEGHSYTEIAARLHRSVRTIERHRDRLGQKLGAHNCVQLARFAIRAGLAELPNPAERADLERAGFDPLEFSGPVRRLADSRRRSS